LLLLYRGSLKSKLVTGAKIITAPVWKRVVRGQVKAGEGTKHEKDMEAFYKFQKDGEASIRLCARDP
jgi:hypothetical protein